MQAKIQTKVIKLSEIKENPKNPKRHLVDKISESMQEMGYVEPVVVDEDNMILAGHGRVKALSANNVKEVEVIVKTGLVGTPKFRHSFYGFEY